MSTLASSGTPVRDLWAYHTRNNGVWGQCFWGQTKINRGPDRHLKHMFMWALEPCGSIPANRDRFDCGPECTSTCHITTVCSGNCHKKWCRPAAGMVNIEVPNWRPTNILREPKSWKAWDLEFCPRLRKMSPGMIAVLQGDMTFADFHASTIANLDEDDAYRRAKDYMRMSVWVGFSVSGPGAHLGLPESPLDQDQAVGPVWDAWQTHYAESLLRIYWHVYHLYHVDPPRIRGLRRVWNTARSMMDSQPVSEPSPCRCQQCVPVDPEHGTDLPSLSWGQWDQGYDQLGYA